MKSQMIRIRNIPLTPPVVQTVNTKPIGFIFAMVIIGIALIGLEKGVSLGIIMLTLGIFALLVMPDRKLVEVTEDYLIMYNCKDSLYCHLIYWDEILSWTYAWHADMDELIIELENHQIEIIESYSRSIMRGVMMSYAKGKEKKVNRHEQ